MRLRARVGGLADTAVVAESLPISVFLDAYLLFLCVLFEINTIGLEFWLVVVII